MKKWINLQPNSMFFNIFSAIMLGIVLTFAFAPYEIFPLGLLAPAGLLALWIGKSPKQAFFLGLLFGLGFFGVGVYWVYISIHVIGEVPVPLAALITVGFITILSLFIAITGYVLNNTFPEDNTIKFVCAFPSLWLLSEWLRTLAFTGFPWLFLGYSQTNSALSGFAPLLSVYGVTFAVAMCSALIVNGVINYQRKQYPQLYFSAIAFLAIWAVGGLSGFQHWTKPDGKPVTVTLVQGNIEQMIKWSPDHLQFSIDRYISLSEPYWGKSDFIIWPEAAIPVPLPTAAPLINQLDKKARDSKTALILGIPIQADLLDGYYNSIVSVGEYRNVYNKRHLVPFGEYTPLSDLFARALNFMNIPMSNMVAGNFAQGPFNFGSVKILASVCYEIAYPSLIRSYNNNVNMLLSVTNDAWFGKSNAQAQHLQMAQMRAMELERPTLFVSNDGITAIISPDGKIHSAAPQWQATVLTGSVQPLFGLTPWMILGTDPILLLALTLLTLAVYKKRKKIKLLKKKNASVAQATETN